MHELIESGLAVFGAFIVISGGITAIVSGIKAITSSHDKKQQYDEYDQRINVLDNRVTEIDKKVSEKFTAQHVCMQQELGEMQTTMDAKLQQINSELCMLSYCVGATLDGLKQLKCDGKVTEAKEKMDKHLNQQAHGEI